MLHILALGDVVGTKTIDVLRQRLWQKRQEWRVDFVVANGENATDIHGVNARDAKAILDCGVDLITLGNHTYTMRDLHPFLDNNPDSSFAPPITPHPLPAVATPSATCAAGVPFVST